MKRTAKPSAIVQEHTQLLLDLQVGEAKEIDAKTEKWKPASAKSGGFCLVLERIALTLSNPLHKVFFISVDKWALINDNIQ